MLSNNRALRENKKIHQKQLEMLSTNDKILNWFNAGKTYWRYKTIEKFEIFLDKQVFGNILEIGAGTAWCSAVVSKKSAVEKVFTLEFDTFSIENLMPKVFNALGANTEKIEILLGSFDNINIEDDSIDFIFAMGAMHHSQNLLTTYNELYRVLKPGGFVLISDPAYSNSLTLQEEFQWRESVKSNGSKRKDNGDQKFRLCQWEAYAYQAGFNVYPFTFDRVSSISEATLFGDDMIKKHYTYDRFNKKNMYPYFAKNIDAPLYDRLMLILEKPSECSYKSMSENVYFS